MSSVISLTAHTLVEHCISHEEEAVSSACDAAVQFLAEKGFLPRERGAFLRAVKQELKKQDAVVPVLLKTPSGESGEHAKALTASLEKTLVQKIELQEVAVAGLLGGAHLSFGDDQFDATLRGALAGLSSHLRSSFSSVPPTP